MEIFKEKQKIKLLSASLPRFLFHLATALMLGRVFILESISPFAISYLCTYVATGERRVYKTILTVLFSIIGILTTDRRETAIRYLLAFVLFGLVYISLTIVRENEKLKKAVISAVTATAISGVIYYAQVPNLTLNLCMLGAECILCGVLPFIIRDIPEIICRKNLFESIKNHEKIGICIISVIIAGGFCGLEIGGISLGKVVCGVLLMTVAYTENCALTVTFGVGMGILFSLYAFEYNEYPGILGFCGLVTGLAARLKRQGIILFFIVAARLLTVYFSGWSDSIFSPFEVTVSVCLFCLIPKSLLMRISAYFSAESTKSVAFEKHREILRERLGNMSALFGGIAELSKKIAGIIPENLEDAATVYEITASKVCKSCGLKFICWDKEAFDTRDALNKAVCIMRENGHITPDTMPVAFKSKCVRYENFTYELNRTYLKYAASGKWQQGAKQTQKMLLTQLKGVSDIMEDFSQSFDKDISFDQLDESKIMYGMEQAGIKCRDVTVVKDYKNTTTVTVTVKHKNGSFNDLCKITELTVSDALKKQMQVESYSLERNNFTIRLKETEKYSVSFSYLSVPKKGESLCGDSLIHGRLAKGKYGVFLSDGMGCGQSAADRSSVTAELMEKFLSAGFEANASVDMINSTLMLSGSESFATLDAVIIDLFTARVRFIKSGANTTYIKAKARVEKISSDTLPLGIINDVKAKTNDYQTADGDTIILISDGVQSITDNDFEEYIRDMNEAAPEKIARLIMDEARRRGKGDDDMTVAVLKIKKQGGKICSTTASESL